MIDITKVRAEMAAVYADAQKSAETYADATPEVQAEHEAKLDKLANYQKSIDAAERLAKYAFGGEQKVDAVVVKASKSADQIAVEANNGGAQNVVGKISREEYAAMLSAFVRGDSAETYASITTASGGGALLPNIVKAGINLIAVNPYRAALAATGYTPVTFGSTAKVSSPVISPFAGAALPEDGNAETNGNADAKLGVLSTVATGFQSTVFWYSNLELAALDFDFTASNLPAQAGATDTAFAKAISAKIKTDAAVTLSVTTASTSTITLDNLDDLNNALDPVYDSSKAISLSKSAYIAAEKLKDSTGMPILSRDVQNQSLLRYKGTPVVKDTTLDAMGTSTNLVGMVIGYAGFQLRDEQEKVLRYVNDADRPDKTGVNHIAYRGFGYVPGAIAKLVN